MYMMLVNFQQPELTRRKQASLGSRQIDVDFTFMRPADSATEVAKRVSLNVRAVRANVCVRPGTWIFRGIL